MKDDRTHPARCYAEKDEDMSPDGDLSRRYFQMSTPPGGVHIVRENAYKGRTGILYGLCGAWPNGEVSHDRRGATVCKSCQRIAEGGAV